MKRFLTLAGTLFILLIGVLIFRTARFTSKQTQVSAVDLAPIDSDLASRHLADAIGFATVSNDEEADRDASQFQGLRDYLQVAFPLVHSALQREIVAQHSLLFTWTGSEPGRPPILLMGHMDVVPVEPGTERDWTYPPFDGRIADGFIWGRGAIDDKVTVLGLLEAVESLLQQGFRPKRTIYLAFGHDEEARGTEGATAIAALLGSRGVHPEYILDEGGAITTGVVPGISTPVALVKIAEKGYVTIEMTVESQGGHSSMPPRETAIGILAEAITVLESHPMPASIRGATRVFFELVGPEMPVIQRTVMANLWLLEPLLKHQLARSPTSDAVIRTTTAPTMFEAGSKENVLPLKARAVVNFRILPGDTIASVMDHVRKTVRDDRVRIAAVGAGSEPSPIAPVDSPDFQTLARTIREVYPGTIVAPDLAVGATDSRHYMSLTDDVYGFAPCTLASEDLRRFHGTDERISVQAFARAVQFYVHLIRSTSVPG
ncbi:MAG: M20 family peptidase [Acidobacteria bacterium]|nr:M20 family peptidase [Acidobacteriota bacterium]